MWSSRRKRLVCTNSNSPQQISMIGFRRCHFPRHKGNQGNFPVCQKKWLSEQIIFCLSDHYPNHLIARRRPVLRGRLPGRDNRDHPSAVLFLVQIHPHERTESVPWWKAGQRHSGHSADLLTERNEPSILCETNTLADTFCHRKNCQFQPFISTNHPCFHSHFPWDGYESVWKVKIENTGISYTTYVQIVAFHSGWLLWCNNKH